MNPRNVGISFTLYPTKSAQAPFATEPPNQLKLHLQQNLFQALTFRLSTSWRSSLLGLKKGILLGGTSTGAPVFGLRAMRPRLWRVWKVPNPRISTLSPDRTARTMASNMAQTTTSDSLMEIAMAW